LQISYYQQPLYTVQLWIKVVGNKKFANTVIIPRGMIKYRFIQLSVEIDGQESWYKAIIVLVLYNFFTFLNAK
jgi:hypothetical protein